MNRTAARGQFPARRAAPRFTLLELLIVVGIMGLLMSMILPAVNQAKDRGKAIECAGNLRQFGTAVMSYADDSDDFFPNHNDDNGGSNWTRSVFLCSSYYEHNFKIIRCPTDLLMTMPPASVTAVFPFRNDSYYWSYCYNRRMCDQFPDANPPSTVRLRSFLQPSQTITYFEGNENDGGIENQDGDGPTDNPFMAPFRRHTAGAEYLFADSHVDWRRAGTLALSEFTRDAD